MHYHIKFTDTNKNTNGNFLSEDCDELYQQNSLSLYLSVNTDENILLVYTEEFIEGKKELKKPKDTMTCYLYRQNCRWNEPVSEIYL